MGTLIVVVVGQTWLLWERTAEWDLARSQYATCIAQAQYWERVEKACPLHRDL